VLITVPAFQKLFSRHDEFLGHYRRYNLQGISSTAEKAGLEILERSYFFSSLLLPRTLTWALEKNWVVPSGRQGSRRLSPGLDRSFDSFGALGGFPRLRTPRSSGDSPSGNFPVCSSSQAVGPKHLRGVG